MAWCSTRFADLASSSGGALYNYQANFKISERVASAGAMSEKYFPDQGVGPKAVAAEHKFVANGLNILHLTYC